MFPQTDKSIDMHGTMPVEFRGDSEARSGCEHTIGLFDESAAYLDALLKKSKYAEKGKAYFKDFIFA